MNTIHDAIENEGARGANVRRAALAAGLLLLTVAALPAWAAAKPPAPPPPATPQATLVVEAKLLAKSPTPTLNMASSVWVYGEGYVMYQYEVQKVVQGELKDKKILVAHWGLKRRIVQPVTETQVGTVVTLSLCPFNAEKGKSDQVFMSDATNDFNSPTFLDVAQKTVMPPGEAGRWNYGASIGRVMRTYHLLRNQVKLVVLGDCQGWFSSRTRLWFPEENLKTPVALCLTQERSALSFYEMLAQDYLIRTPKLEWVVFAYHTRWLNGQAHWAVADSATAQFKNSPGYKYDMANAKEVFAPVQLPPIELKQILAQPDMARAWNGAPWGELPRAVKEGGDLLKFDLSTLPPPAGLEAKRTLQDRTANPQYSKERWEEWERIVKLLVDHKIRVLAYTFPININKMRPGTLDKNGTTVDSYADQVNYMRELEEKYKGYFFFFDYNNFGKSGETADWLDHPTTEQAIRVTAAANEYVHQMMKKYNFSTRPVGKP